MQQLDARAQGWKEPQGTAQGEATAVEVPCGSFHPRALASSCWPFSPEELAAFCRRHRIGWLALCGSAARGELRPESDLDLLVEFEAGASISLFDLMALRDELTALLGRPVDLGVKSGLKPSLRESILATAVTLYAP